MITESGGIIYSHYHFAHGESDPYPKDHPKRCQIENLYRAARDLNLRVEEIKKIHPSLPLVVLGHSLGGLISTLMAKVYPEYGDNGGMMVRTAYHMLEVQTKLMTELNQI